MTAPDAIDPQRGAARCACTVAHHRPHLVVVTGGPGGGKTALLELARRDLCAHSAILPEAAGILFAGGFPRRTDEAARCAAQRAIFAVQRELERDAVDRGAGLVLCDRGTLDGAAYWPRGVGDYLRAIDINLTAELGRYSAVIHMRVPPPREYNHHNPLRTESAAEAARIDERIADVWRAHPRYHEIGHRDDFLAKLHLAMRIVRQEVPACCRPSAATQPEAAHTGETP